jgi:hypothetical protein
MASRKRSSKAGIFGAMSAMRNVPQRPDRPANERTWKRTVQSLVMSSTGYKKPTASCGTGVTPGSLPKVQVVDQGNVPVQGVRVWFEVAAGDGLINGVTRTCELTDSNGEATLASWVLGAQKGNNRVVAHVDGVSSSAVFDATAK